LHRCTIQPTQITNIPLPSKHGNERHKPLSINPKA
jgi:hypothetical protein